MSALLIAAGASGAAAETVRLKNGNTLRGKVISQTETELAIDLPGMGTVTFPMGDVVSVEEDREAEGLFTHSVKLTNGNELFGSIEEQTPERLTVAIPGTGTLLFTAAEVASVQPLSPEQIAELEAEFQQDQKSRAAKTGRSGQVLDRLGGMLSSRKSKPADLDAEIQERRKQALAKTEEARALVKKVQAAQSGLVPLPLSPSLAGGGQSPEEILRQQSPLAGMILDLMLKAWGWMMLVGLFAIIFFPVCLQRLAERTGTDGEWMAWVPLAHIYLAIRVAGRPGWWLILYFVPLVSLVIDVLVWAGIARARGKSAWLGLAILLPVVNFIVAGVLAFGKDPEPLSPGLAPR